MRVTSDSERVASVPPLAGLSVVAVEQAVAAPLCTRHLADLGADVIKVEPPGGDFARAYDSVAEGQSAHFVWLARGKRSIVLDLHRPSDRDVLSALLARADVFVHNLVPGAIDRLGFGWETVHGAWPGLISCAISGYGQNGPYSSRKAFDLLLQGEAGVLSVTGTEDAPAKVGIPIADISAGMYALTAILVALRTRDRTAMGSFVDISMLECLTEWMGPFIYHQKYGGRAPARSGMRHSSIVPYGPFRLADDSLVNLAVQNQGQWQRLCERVLRRPELVADPSFRANEDRLRERIVLERLIDECLAKMQPEEARRRLADADIPFGDVNDVRALIAHPQLASRGRWLEVSSPGGMLTAAAHPINLEGLSQRLGEIPALDQHGDEIRREVGLRTTRSRSD
jgi:itaconate CoA-transferase